MQINIKFLDEYFNEIIEYSFDRLDVFGKWIADNYDHIEIIEVIQEEWLNWFIELSGFYTKELIRRF